MLLVYVVAQPALWFASYYCVTSSPHCHYVMTLLCHHYQVNTVTLSGCPLVAGLCALLQCH